MPLAPVFFTPTRLVFIFIYVFVISQFLNGMVFIPQVFMVDVVS